MPHTTLDAPLQHLGACLACGALDIAQYRRALARLLQQAFGCSRVGLWQVVGSEGQRAIRCLAQYQEGHGDRPGGDELSQHQYQAYFDHLVSRGVFVSSDTWNDPVLAPMRECYLVPSDTRSMMDAAFTLNGRTFGMLCCEQIGSQRHWTTAEVIRLKRCASVITLHTARHERGESVWWDVPAEAA